MYCGCNYLFWIPVISIEVQTESMKVQEEAVIFELLCSGPFIPFSWVIFFCTIILFGLLLPAPPYHLPAPPYSRQIYHLTLFKIFHIPLYPPLSLLLLTASTNRRQKKCSTVCRNRNVYYFYGFYKP